MKMQSNPHELLKEALPSSRLFIDWLSGQLGASFLNPEHRDAGRELERALADIPGGKRAAPLFCSSWASGWATSLEADLPGDLDRERFRHDLQGLRDGELDVVVTGQQPGFLGGPLYTLYKIATAVAVARVRTEAGRPTVPVFWSGDDDDDLAEALGPVAWDPLRSDLVRSTGRGNTGQRASVVGRMHGQPWTAEAAAWFGRVSSKTPDVPCLASDLSTIWKDAVDGSQPWSRLARRAVLRTFSGTGLMVVSGDDAGLHATAAPLYRKITGCAETLRDLARSRGRELAAGPWHAQISDRSLARPLFRMDGDHRVPLEISEPVEDPSLLRPGVMLRSPVQDWLLEPAAVVVGPGELAYLRQLDPVYEELGVVRPPLVPRLFAWLTPPGFDPGKLAALLKTRRGDPNLAQTLADRAETEAREILEGILTDDLGLESDRAAGLAAGRTRRWRKGVAAMLADELERKRRQDVPADPVWVFPDGLRQERRLAYGCAAAFWGDDLVEASLETARRHIEYGGKNDWREFTIEVPEPR